MALDAEAKAFRAETENILRTGYISCHVKAVISP